MAMLRMVGGDLHSNYGPTADTGGLMQNHAPTIYGYPSLEALVDGEATGGKKTPLPGAAGKSRDRAPGQEIILRSGVVRGYSGLVMTPQAMRGGAPEPVPPATA